MSEKILIVIATMILIWWLCGLIYILSQSRIFIKLYHDLMGWHLPDYKKDVTSDSVNTYAVCKHCGKEIMRDSQGNWF